ncbi:MAG: hypothetical protein ACJAZO_001530 [Myxococcota bacterium]
MNNYTPYCGVRVNTGIAYEVTLGSDPPVVAGLDGTSLLYTNDIELTAQANVGEHELAAANVPGGSDCTSDSASIVLDSAGQ